MEMEVKGGSSCFVALVAEGDNERGCCLAALLLRAPHLQKMMIRLVQDRNHVRICRNQEFLARQLESVTWTGSVRHGSDWTRSGWLQFGAPGARWNRFFCHDVHAWSSFV